MFPSSLLPPLAGGLAAALGALVGSRLKLKNERKWLLSGAAGVAAAGAVALAVAPGPGQDGSAQQPSAEAGEPSEAEGLEALRKIADAQADLIINKLGPPLAEKARRKSMDKLQAEPEYQRWAKQRLEAGATSEQLTAEIPQLVAQGIPRLDDQSLSARLVITRALLHRSDEATCAALYNGALSEEEMNVLIGTNFETGMMEGWFEISHAAALAELRQAPTPDPSGIEARTLLDEVLADHPEAERERMRRYLTIASTASDTETCWFARTVCDGLMKMKGDSLRQTRLLYSLGVLR